MSGRKYSHGLVTRFGGRGGRSNLTEALARQQLVKGDHQLAKRLSQITSVQEVKRGSIVSLQGSNDNDLYFILSGSVSIKVNGREVAVRYAGEQVGEMSVLDCTARRSATIETREDSVLAKLTELAFRRLTKRFPELWHRVALVIASRLRERNRFHPVPHERAVVFVGSSSEGKSLAEEIVRSLRRSSCIPYLWCESVFQPSRTTIEDLFRQSVDSDFALIVLTPDDVTLSRGTRIDSPRDNAIFELGLFTGALSRERTIIAKPKHVDIKIPSDLFGVTMIEYKPQCGKSKRARLAPVVKTLKGLIKRLGPR